MSSSDHLHGVCFMNLSGVVKSTLKRKRQVLFFILSQSSIKDFDNISCFYFINTLPTKTSKEELPLLTKPVTRF